MTWNYRLCKQTYRGDGYEEDSYEIREAYYNKDGSIWAVTENAKGVYGDTIESAKECITWMQQAFEKEIIDLDTFVFAKADFEDNEDEV